MKQTTRKVLLWLYSNEDNPRVVQAKQIKLLLPELKDSGFRSLLNLLKKKQLISLDQIGNKEGYRITSFGLSALEAEFPLFSKNMKDWSGEWTIIFFLNAPASDKQFRYLRTFLIKEQCYQLSRGVYIFPGKLSERVDKLLLKLYVGAVCVASLDKWLFGDEKSLINNIFDLNSLKNNYSGISSSIDGLLEHKKKKKGSNNRDIELICLVFENLIASLNVDLGLLSHYDPGFRSGVELLKSLQEAF